MTEDLDRRGALKKLLAMGAAVPLAGVWARTAQTRTVRAQAAALTSAQLAGQRVIFSYSGLTVPSALLQQISAGQAAGVIFFGGTSPATPRSRRPSSSWSRHSSRARSRHRCY